MIASKSFVWGNPKGMLKSPQGQRPCQKLRVFAVALFVFGPLVFAGCQKKPEKTPEEASILLERWGAPSPKVENGLAYDKATLNMGDLKTLVVPADAKVEQGPSVGQVEIFMEKCQSFGGHPPTRMSIRDTRKHMGCAERNENDKIVLATYGDWDSGIEGGTSMHVLIRVPDGVEVERRENLSGPIRAKRLPKHPPNRPLVEPGKDGWEALPNEPDPKQTAEFQPRVWR